MDLIQAAFQWPNIVPSTLMSLAILYWLLVIVGAMDIELFDLDLDADVDVGGFEGVTGMGMVVLRFLNVGRVPLMIWGSIFAVTFWFSSMLLFDFWDNPKVKADAFGGSLLLLRNFVLSVAIAKLVTNPMRKWFHLSKGPTPEQMIGEICELASDLAPGQNGQARFRTSAAPRLLTVRTEKGALCKGDLVELVRYTAETKTFWVTKREDEV
jgi:hypothetical protein